MTHYPFRIVNHSQEGALEDNAALARRPFSETDSSFEADAKRFFPGDELETAINTAIAVGEPLLITGEPGTGKTQAAYYAAYKLNLDKVLHFQVKSDSTARDLLYHFDTVRYFHDAHIRVQEQSGAERRELNKADYVEPRVLWEAFESAQQQQRPRVVLIDEIDKAPRDFPNDLLHELDKMEFVVAETGEKRSAPKSLQPIVFITSNSERRLPEPFLRRCVYHHIRFDDRIVYQAVENRREEYQNLDDGILKLAIERFLQLRDRKLRKPPATGELLVWLRVLALATGTLPERLDRSRDDLAALPYLGVLLKDRLDMEELQRGGG